MMGISGFRIGNYASFDGLLQRIESAVGLSHSDYLDPLPITISMFRSIGYSHHFESEDHIIYFFDTVDGDGISVAFRSETRFVVMEKVSRIEYPFLKWVHEIQNLVEDKIQKKATALPKGEKRTIVVE